MTNILSNFGQTKGTAILNTVFTALIALIIANIAIKAINKVLDKASKMDATVKNFVKPLIRFVIYFFVCLFIANSLGFDTSSIVALASVLSAAIALAAQNVLSNLFGGITMLAVRPFKIGDYISGAGSEGTVMEIGMFYTVLHSVDNKRITIPNGTLASSTVINYSSEGRRKVEITVSASYDNGVDEVKKAIAEAIEMTKGASKEDTFIHLKNYGASAIDYIARVWCDSGDYWNVYFDLMENIKVTFDKNGIQFTYDHIIVHNEK